MPSHNPTHSPTHDTAREATDEIELKLQLPDGAAEAAAARTTAEGLAIPHRAARCDLLRYRRSTAAATWHGTATASFRPAVVADAEDHRHGAWRIEHTARVGVRCEARQRRTADRSGLAQGLAAACLAVAAREVRAVASCLPSPGSAHAVGCRLQAQPVRSGDGSRADRGTFDLAGAPSSRLPSSNWNSRRVAPRTCCRLALRLVGKGKSSPGPGADSGKQGRARLSAGHRSAAVTRPRPRRRASSMHSSPTCRSAWHYARSLRMGSTCCWRTPTGCAMRTIPSSSIRRALRCAECARRSACSIAGTPIFLRRWPTNCAGWVDAWRGTRLGCADAVTLPARSQRCRSNGGPHAHANAGTCPESNVDGAHSSTRPLPRSPARAMRASRCGCRRGR